MLVNTLISNKDMMNGNTYIYQGGRPDLTTGNGITHVIVKDGVTSIDNSAFAFWKDLISVHIPSSVTAIGQEAFDGCSSLTFINLPESLQRIGTWAFYNCSTILIYMSIRDHLAKFTHRY